ncbi:MAG: PD40 domain-containing protein [Oligoflexales bacterium]|nr:PD40 domain-containing protein [Oligoflexales bacterium]
MNNLRWFIPFLMIIFFGSSSVSEARKSKSTPIFRFKNQISHLRISPKAAYLAYIEQTLNKKKSLKILEIKNKKIFLVSKAQVGSSFFWAPHGYRLFYRELKQKQGSSGVESTIKAYDSRLRKSIEIERISKPTGYITLDPMDLKIRTMSSTKLHVHQIVYPGSRLAKWQLFIRSQKGHWCVTQNGVLWMLKGVSIMSKLEDDGSPIEAFAISPDGRSIAWNTKKGLLYVSHEGTEPKILGYGKHPHWHPSKKILVYSGARMLGKVVSRYDLRVSNSKGQSRWITHSQHSDEMWPIWHPQGKLILYTVKNTSDIYMMDFTNAIIARSSYPHIK